MLHLASQGEFVPVVQATLAYRRQVLPSASIGLYLSITCAEHVPWIKRNEAERLVITHLITDFVERGREKGLDVSCLKNVKRNGFGLERQASP